MVIVIYQKSDKAARILNDGAEGVLNQNVHGLVPARGMHGHAE
jgi:hypothetical protein